MCSCAFIVMRRACRVYNKLELPGILGNLLTGLLVIGEFLWLQICNIRLEPFIRWFVIKEWLGIEIESTIGLIFFKLDFSGSMSTFSGSYNGSSWLASSSDMFSLLWLAEIPSSSWSWVFLSYSCIFLFLVSTCLICSVYPSVFPKR